MPRRSSKVDPELIQLLHEAVLAGKVDPGDATQVMRRKEGLSQAQLARCAGVSLRTVQQLEGAILDGQGFTRGR